MIISLIFGLDIIDYERLARNGAERQGKFSFLYFDAPGKKYIGNQKVVAYGQTDKVSHATRNL